MAPLDSIADRLVDAIIVSAVFGFVYLAGKVRRWREGASPFRASELDLFAH